MARYYNQPSYLDYLSDFSSIPLHLWFFITLVVFVLGLTWYINYESMFEDMVNRVKLFIILSPLVLLLIVHLLSGGFPFFVPYPERNSLHRAGGTPWGVGLLLAFLLFMVSYQSSFHERWFPLVTK